MTRLIDLATQRRARALGDYWDAVVRRSSSADHRRPASDQELADLIITIQRVADGERAHSASEDSTLRRLLIAHQEMNTMPTSTLSQPAPSVLVPPSSPRVHLPALPRSIGGRWASVALIAAVILVALSLVSNPSRPIRNWIDDRNEPGRPAIQAPATPAPTPSDTVRLTVDLPADALPSSERISSGLQHVTLPPGSRSTWTPTCCPGPFVEYVVEGAYSVRAEAPIQVVRAGGTEERIPAGTEVVLGPGDALISRNETAAEGANTGSEPVELLNWVLIDDTGFNGHSLPDSVPHEADVQERVTVPVAPATLRIEAVELAPGETISGTRPGTLFFSVVVLNMDVGTPWPSVSRDLEVRDVGNIGDDPFTLYVLTLESHAAATGAPAAATPGAATPAVGTPSA